MGKIILITGGSRSGKSGFAARLAEKMPGRRVFVATCPVTDDEMRRRIEAHQRDRADGGWETVEETMDLARVLEQSGGAAVILVDCLTLWVNNQMYEAEKQGGAIGEQEIARGIRETLDVCRRIAATVIFVTNEVGMGIVPGDGTTRLFRDMSGRCNQVVGMEADAVVLVVCGVPMIIKGEVSL